jgi:hypothetical protein
LNPRTTLIVVAVFALLAGYLFFSGEFDKTTEQVNAQLGTPTAKPPTYVMQFDSLQVQQIQISDLRAARQVTVARSSDGWQLKPQDQPADKFMVELALGSLANLSANRVLTNVVDLAPYGLVTATLEARVVMSDSKQFAVTIGNKTPDSRYFYAIYTGDKSKVFLIDVGNLNTLQDWLDKPPYQPTATPTLPPIPTPADLPTATPKP